jgi:transcriptional regulator with GAF, ATPase, and Fis domain
MVNRERAVTEAFVTLARNMADGVEMVDLLGRLAADTAALLGVHSTGVLLSDGGDMLHVVAASSEATRNLEIFQLQRDQGPCLDCFRTGLAVSVTDLREQERRWPQFVPAALRAGFASVHALPVRVRDTVLGTLGLFARTTGRLDEEDLTLAQALAYVAGVAIVQDKAATDRNLLNEQLQTALDSRVVLEQAKGVLAQRGELQMDQAFHVLRGFARDHNRRLTDVARAVVARELPAQILLDHARTRGPNPSIPD